MPLIPLHSIIETFPGPVWVQDAHGHLTWCNDTWQRYTGRNAALLAGEHYSQFFHPDDQEAMLMAVIQSMKVGGWTGLNARIVDSHGDYQRFHIKLGYFTDPEEGGAHWLGLAVDAGEVRSRPETEPESEKRLKLALEAAALAVWDWDVIAGEMFWDLRAFELFGIGEPPEKVTPDYFLQLVHESDRSMVRAKLDEALNQYGTFRAEFRILRPDRKEKWVCCDARVTSRLQAHRINMIGIMYDITTRKLHERQKDEFIGIACHELRTPVTSIKAYGQLLQRQLAEHASAHEHEGRPSFEEEARIIERLVYQSDRLSQLVRRLLDTTRIAEHKLELDYGWFDWETLVEHCIDAVRAGDVISSITFENGRVGKVYADQERIQQVCLNLLSNALKFSGPGSPIIVRTWRENGRAGFSVKDYGAGIPESMIETVFEPFVQLKQRTAAGHSGLGLGLYISAGIIHRHGGEIGAQSKPGEGALFYFTIPAIPTGNTDRP